MTAFQPKNYQTELQAGVRTYFEACHEFASPATAFTLVTERLWQKPSAYRPLAAGRGARSAVAGDRCAVGWRVATAAE